MKNCDCFDKTQNALREKTQDPLAELAAVFTLSGEVFPRIPYTYRKKKKDGVFQSKITEGTMFPNFCPFCGVKYIRA